MKRFVLFLKKAYSKSFKKSFIFIQGTLLNEIVSPMSMLTGSFVTAMCTDQFGEHIYAGDSLGYITMYSLKDFCEKTRTHKKINYLTTDSNLITMNVCWKAHLNKIVKLDFIHLNKLLISASVDESVR